MIKFIASCEKNIEIIPVEFKVYSLLVSQSTYIISMLTSVK